MKREDRNNMLIGIAFGIVIPWCSVGCLLTAMDLELTNAGNVFMWSLLLCFLFCLCFSRKHGGWYLLVGAFVAGRFLLREGSELLLQIESLIHRISNVYDYYYHWGYIQWSEGDLSEVPIDLAVILVIALCALPVCWAVCRKKKYCADGFGQYAAVAVLYAPFGYGTGCGIRDFADSEYVAVAVVPYGTTQKCQGRNPADSNASGAGIGVIFDAVLVGAQAGLFGRNEPSAAKLV